MGWARVLPLVLLAVFGACSAPSGSGSGKPVVRIGSTNFTEQVILAELYGQVLEAKGYRVERKLNLGSREVVAPALESGQIDLYPEYLATYLTFVTKDPAKASSDAAATHRALQEALKAKNLSAFDFGPAVDTNGFVVTKATADRLGLSKVSDLAKANNELILGGPPECPARPFCQMGLDQTYGIKFKEFMALDAGGAQTVAALEGNQINVAVLFTTDAVIQAKGFVLLQDDKRLQLADNIVPVARAELIDKAPAELKDLINSVTTKVTTEELTGLNRQVGVDRRDPKDAAAAWLKAKGLVG